MELCGICYKLDTGECSGMQGPVDCGNFVPHDLDAARAVVFDTLANFTRMLNNCMTVPQRDDFEAVVDNTEPVVDILNGLSDDELDNTFCKKCVRDCEDTDCIVGERRQKLHDITGIHPPVTGDEHVDIDGKAIENAVSDAMIELGRESDAIRLKRGDGVDEPGLKKASPVEHDWYWSVGLPFPNIPSKITRKTAEWLLGSSWLDIKHACITKKGIVLAVFCHVPGDYHSEVVVIPWNDAEGDSP